MSSSPELYIGLMSGTSMDGIDAALVDLSSAQAKLICTHNHSWPKTVQQALITARDIADDKLNTLSALDIQTAEVFAQACIALLGNTDYQAQDVVAIGNHGQTIRHRPNIETPFSLQIGNANKLAALTGINVISDFRNADIKAGGQGAPLAPAFHQAVFQQNNINRGIVNIGGIANITLLPGNAEQAIVGFDCGPGNTLMDAWMLQHKQQHYDTDGALASSGKTNATLLARLLMDDYFQLAAPKSTGFEYFNIEWLNQYMDNYLQQPITVADVQSTLCDLTATSIIRAINQTAANTQEIYICGGGVHNKALMHRLQLLTKCPVKTTQALAIHPDWVEAIAFAWLAYRHSHQLTGNLPAVTGANSAEILGHLSRSSDS